MRIFWFLIILALITAPAAACRITNQSNWMCIQEMHWVVQPTNNTYYLLVMVVENTNSTLRDRVLPLPEPGDVPIENAAVTLRPRDWPGEDWPIGSPPSELIGCHTDARGICITDLPEGYIDKKFDIVIEYNDAQGRVRYTDPYVPPKGLSVSYLIIPGAAAIAYIIYRHRKKTS